MNRQPLSVLPMEALDVSSMNDEQLAAAAQSGTQLAFTELANRYWDKLNSYVRRLQPGTSEAEDIVQDALLKAYTNLRSFNTERRFSPWIYRITHNAFVDHVKSRARDPLPFFDPEVLFPHPVATDNPAVEADIGSIRRLLDAHLNDLDRRYREPLILRYYEDLSYKDIGDILRIPVGTVSIRIKRGLAKLRLTIPRDVTV